MSAHHDYVEQQVLAPLKACTTFAEYLSLELPECLTCLDFHPEDPSLLAGGAFNGDVLMWNLAAAEDKLVGKSTLCNYTHHEPVQRVCWTKDPLRRGHRGYLLCSIAADGKVFPAPPRTTPPPQPAQP